jgi:very-short-patch-repair endonuclease
MKNKKAKPDLIKFARTLRKEQTTAEKLLWRGLRNRNLEEIKFRRQHPVGPFIVDFYCHAAQLVIEVDGEVNELEVVRKRDKRREEYLRQQGLTIIRFTNEEVIAELGRVLDDIERLVKSLSRRERVSTCD